MIIAAISTLFFALVIVTFIATGIHAHWTQGSMGSALVLAVCGAAVIYQASRFIQSASAVQKMPPLVFHPKEVVSVVCGALAAAMLVREGSLSPVMASALVGIAAGTWISGYAFSLYCGSFIGMTGAWILSYPQMLAAALIAGVVFTLARQGFHGMGGKLGVTAFFGVAVTAVFFLDVQYLNPERVVALNLGQDTGLLLACAAAAFLTQWLHYSKRLHVVASSGWVGLAGALLTIIFPFLHPGLLAAAIFSASFSGMCSSQRIRKPQTILMAGFLCGLLFLLTEPVFFLFGGKLGTIAFTASLVAKTMEEGTRPPANPFFCSE